MVMAAGYEGEVGVRLGGVMARAQGVSPSYKMKFNIGT